MITKKDLEQYRDNKKLAADLERRIELLESRMYGLSALRYTGMPSAQNQSGETSQIRAVDDASEERDALVVLFKEASCYLERNRLSIERELLKLPPTPQMILREFYIDGKTMRKIAESHSYSLEQTKRLKRRGIKIITLPKDDPSRPPDP